ncbi:hypothetical protein A4S06_03730 [Erysipelotrichaceae bacterium MTC7]|nr:hypothetical protein A4S06_03730 [Erysipelotrichaceae bacterium MTC7]
MRLLPMNETYEQQSRVLYQSIFPRKKRIPWQLFKRRKLFTIYYIEDNGEYYGFLVVVYYKDIAFVHYFAITEAARSKGVGSLVLAEFKRMNPGKRIVTDNESSRMIDEDNLKTRKRRQKFFEENGFHKCPFLVSIGEDNYDVFTYQQAPLTYQEYKEMMVQAHGILFRFFMKEVKV